MTDWHALRRRKEEVKARALHPDSTNSHCKAPGCPNQARAGTSDGLGYKYCRSHYDHFQRHGSPFKTTYKAAVLNPYRQAALLWLLEHPDDVWAKGASGRGLGRDQSAGPHIEAFRLRGLKPAERAKALWARLRKHEVDPRLVAAAWLAVEMAIKDDLQPDWRPEYKRVQAAKVIHRMASGTHKKWDQGGRGPAQELHVYPRPRGRVLRHVGQALQEACELLSDYHLGAIHEFKNERDKTGAHCSSPSPKGWVARKRGG